MFKAISVIILGVWLGASANAQHSYGPQKSQHQSEVNPNKMQQTSNGTLTEGQVAQVLMTVNNSEMESGRTARIRSGNKEIKKFAQQLVDSHKKSNQELRRFAAKSDIKPKDSQFAMGLHQNAVQNLSEVKGLKGASFDKAYIQMQVNQHQQVLNSIEQTLLPSVQNPEMKALLEKARQEVSIHLQEAQRIQSTLG